MKTPVSQSLEEDRPLILIIDDEPAIADSLDYSLRGAGFNSFAASSLTEASDYLSRERERICLVILDLSLPDGHGFDWLRNLRATSNIPVVILSSHDDEIEHIVGLELGADDFIDKPFSPREVVARVRAVLRRYSVSVSALSDHLSIEVEAENSTGEAPVAVIDFNRYQVLVHGENLGLSQLEFALFDILVHARGRTLSRAQLLKSAWGGSVSVSERTVDVHITSLRKKWSEHRAEDLIETVRGIGYRLSDSAPSIEMRGQRNL